MFDRKYAARDRRKPRGPLVREYMSDRAEYRIRKAEPLHDGAEPHEDRYWDDVSEYNLSTLTPNQWREYTTPQPFCMVPDAPPERTLPRRPKMVRKDPTYRGFWSALKETAKDLEKQGRKEEAQAHRAKWLNDGPEPPMPTAEQIISKAGGRVVKIA